MHRIAGLVFATALALSAGDVNEDLLAAARTGDLVSIKALIEKGAALETKTPYGQTPLYLAAMNGRDDAVRYLLDKGANADVTDTFYKASMLGFTRSLAREVGRMGVNVNAVAPGFLDTDMTQGLADTQRAQIVRRSALRKLPAVEDVAEAVEFLLGDRSASITGTVLTVDAGSTA